MIKIKLTGSKKELEQALNTVKNTFKVTSKSSCKKLKGNNLYFYYFLDAENLGKEEKGTKKY